MREHVRALCAVAGALVALTACGGTGSGSGSGSDSGSKVDLKIMVGGLDKQIYLPNMLAKQLGYFDQQGLNVQLIDEASGQSSEQEVLAGAVDAGSGSYNHTIELQAAGKRMTEVVQLGIAPGEAELVASKEAGQIHSGADLKGRNLGVTELGSGTQTLTSAILTKNHVGIDQVHFIPVGAGDTFIAGMQQGKIDAGMTTEPTISRVLETGLGKVLYDLRTPDKTKQALGGAYPFICVFMSTAYVNSHRDVTQRIVNAYVKTLKWIAGHTAAQITDKMPADYYASGRAAYVSALANQKAMFSPDGSMPSDGPASVLKIEKEFNSDVQGKSIDLGATYTNQFTSKAS